MARLPVASTARLFLDYVTTATGGVAHTIQFRYSGSDRNAVAAQERVASMLTAATTAAFRAGWQVTAARSALAGEQFTTAIPLNATIDAFSGNNGSAWSRDKEAWEVTFQGRGVASPRRVDISIYGMIAALSVPSTLRWPMSGSLPTGLLAFYNALIAASSPFVAIDGTSIVWYPYANAGMNAYWKRRLRTS